MGLTPLRQRLLGRDIFASFFVKYQDRFIDFMFLTSSRRFCEFLVRYIDFKGVTPSYRIFCISGNPHGEKRKWSHDTS